MSDDINRNTETVATIKQATIEILDAMENGARMEVSDLIDKVVFKTGVKTSTASQLVPIFARDYAGAEVYRGRGGGVIKGGKPTRVDPRPRCGECNQVVRAKVEKE